MNKVILFVGAAAMILIGTTLDLQSFAAVGLGLVWIGVALNDK